ncbi:hypothetical protein LZK98_09235 [Sphingomonas cannabina]|uniref:hypothetical protein n=1 Tax=Sphingomonas cannabina TaxID=2899123 RepID=UPI001F1D1025|nr:hypothetical protein [Sphingomonas cannabina]UIJ47105.1 hypothetical protein LZK98_09235 [Sphingomonas cannabina]
MNDDFDRQFHDVANKEIDEISVGFPPEIAINDALVIDDDQEVVIGAVARRRAGREGLRARRSPRIAGWRQERISRMMPPAGQSGSRYVLCNHPRLDRQFHSR